MTKINSYSLFNKPYDSCESQTFERHIPLPGLRYTHQPPAGTEPQPDRFHFYNPYSSLSAIVLT